MPGSTICQTQRKEKVMKKTCSAMKTGGLMLLLSVLFVYICSAWIYPGRMTGGGSVFTTDGTEVQTGDRVTHGFEIHCGAENGTIPLPNNLEINWSGNRFHLDYLTF